MYTTDILWYDFQRKESVGSWMKFIFPMPNSDPVQNYSLNFRKQKEEHLAWDKTSIQETGAAHVSSQTCIKETCADTLSISPSQASFITQRTIPTTERKWKVIPANFSYGGALSVAVSNMVTTMVLHYDQDERQSDAALHWETIRPVLLKAARDLSEKLWVRLIREGSSKTRFEYCEDSKNSLACLRAIQGHSGGQLIAPVLS